MQKAVTSMRVGMAVAVAAMTAGCVEPAYVMPGPIQLQQYPPAVSYQIVPDDRPPISGPIPLQPAPLVQPLPPPAPAPTVTEVPADDLGNAIPVQDMPTPTTDATTDAPTGSTTDPTTATSDPATAPAVQTVRKTPTTGPGNNVPLEGFRPMHGQTRITP